MEGVYVVESKHLLKIFNLSSINPTHRFYNQKRNLLIHCTKIIKYLLFYNHNQKIRLIVSKKKIIGNTTTATPYLLMISEKYPCSSRLLDFSEC